MSAQREKASGRGDGLRDLARDLVALIGVGLIAFGMWQVWQPGAFLVPGTLLVTIALAPLLRRPRNPEES